MPTTRRAPDDDRSYSTPQAWRNAKVAFGWKPGTSRKHASSLVDALLDLEDYALSSGGCVRFVLELAIRSHLKLAREHKWHIHKKLDRTNRYGPRRGNGRIRPAR